MNTGRYTFMELLEFKNLDQFVIPEIQRDYVWSIPEVSDLLEYIFDGFKTNSNTDVPYLGFIYAYNDKDYVHRYILVDGQQRMTTLYLLLLACYRKMNKRLPQYLIFHEKPKIDYKVRQATHDFLIDFLKSAFISTDNDITSIDDQVWYHAEYANDPTINNMICNYSHIWDWLDRLSPEELPKFTKFIGEAVHISYFDIDHGRQGEDLYIYMNSRGLQLEGNETLKANFLSLVDVKTEKLEWGRVWETWQDFFWKNRDKKKQQSADAGFNEFLKMVQIINMCNQDKPNLEIMRFANDKSCKGLKVHLIASDLKDLKSFFEAYKWLLESDVISGFFERYEANFNYLSPGKDWKLIDYFRILPILNLMARTGIRDIEQIIRFVRFFYNVSRKSDVGKDVASQVPIAVRLINEYTHGKKENLDVCDLVDYQKGRTSIIDTEEIIKLNLFSTYQKHGRRSEIEKLLWSAEDHFIFDGEIYPLLKLYFSSDGDFSEESFKRSLDVITHLFVKDPSLNAQICRALLYYGNTWVQDTPYYYKNYNCQNWKKMVRDSVSKHFFNFVEDMHERQKEYLDEIIKGKIKEYFKDNNLTTLETVKDRDSLMDRMKILVAIDYFTDKIIWKSEAYIAQSELYMWKDYDAMFFKSDNQVRIIYNVGRYIYDGYRGKIQQNMNAVLRDEDRLNEIISLIIS